MKKDSVMFLGLIGAMGAALIVTGSFGKQDAEAEYKYYCEKVSLWERDRNAGIEPSERSGHYNYKGVVCDQKNK